MKIRATEASPGVIHFKFPKGPGFPGINKWVQPFRLDGKPGEWIDIPDSNVAACNHARRYREGGQLEIQNFTKVKSFVITQCAGSPNCTMPIVDKSLNMCYHHAMKLISAVDRAREDDVLAVALGKLDEAKAAAREANGIAEEDTKKEGVRAKKADATEKKPAAKKRGGKKAAPKK